MSNTGEIQESQAEKITRLAKNALDSDDIGATRAFLEEVNRTPEKEIVANQIIASQTGPIDSIFHYASDNPTLSWNSTGRCLSGELNAARFSGILDL